MRVSNSSSSPDDGSAAPWGRAGLLLCAVGQNHNPQEPLLPRSHELGADFNVSNISMGQRASWRWWWEPCFWKLLEFEGRSCKDISVSWVNVVRLRMAPGICKSISTACSMIWSQFYLAGMLWNFSSPCKMTSKNRDGIHFHFLCVSASTTHLSNDKRKSAEWRK